MKSTPTKAIQVELGEVPLDLRRDKLMLTYWVSLCGCGNENPTNSVIKECWEYNSFQGNGFGWVTKAKAEEYRLDSICFNTPTPVSNIPIWLFPKTEVDLNIMEEVKPDRVVCCVEQPYTVFKIWNLIEKI